MGTIYMSYDTGIPQACCTDCGKCQSIMGKSLCKITNRGCCHYFPEFTLVDIQRMVTLEGGQKALDMILSNPGTTINRYSIYSKGTFDKEAYDQYIASCSIMETGSIRDHTIFFRTCPYVQPGTGCKLPPRFRTTVCNFFICSEILELPGCQDAFRPFLEERARYTRWIYRESGILQHILIEHSVDLLTDFSSSARLLAELEPCIYEFPAFEPVSFESMQFHPDLSA